MECVHVLMIQMHTSSSSRSRVHHSGLYVQLPACLLPPRNTKGGEVEPTRVMTMKMRPGHSHRTLTPAAKPGGGGPCLVVRLGQS